MKTYDVTLDGQRAVRFQADFADALVILEAFKSATTAPERISLKEI